MPTYRVRVADGRALRRGLGDLNSIQGTAVPVEQNAHAIFQQRPTKQVGPKE